MIQQGKNGYEYTSADEFLSCLEAILSGSQWRMQAGKRSAEIADSFDTNTFGNTVEIIYNTVVE